MKPRHCVILCNTINDVELLQPQFAMAPVPRPLYDMGYSDNKELSIVGSHQPRVRALFLLSIYRIRVLEADSPLNTGRSLHM